MDKSSSLRESRALYILAGALIALALLSAAALGYGYYRVTNLSKEVSMLHSELASTTSALSGDIAQTNTSLTSDLANQNKNVTAVSDQVNTLQKLQHIDPQLLAKYSKVYFLNENYIPGSLATIPKEYSYFDDKQMQLLPQVVPYLTQMLDAAKAGGVTLYIYSAYRSFDTQAALKKQYKVTFGAGTAGSFSADQGYSEHQLGTAVDFITTGLGGELDSTFGGTTAYVWLLNNAYRYGFVLSYPPGNSYYIYEPWHWRFVGIKLASDLHAKGQYFYDLDQRALNTYLAALFD